MLQAHTDALTSCIHSRRQTGIHGERTQVKLARRLRSGRLNLTERRNTSTSMRQSVGAYAYTRMSYMCPDALCFEHTNTITQYVHMWCMHMHAEKSLPFKRSSVVVVVVVCVLRALSFRRPHRLRRFSAKHTCAPRFVCKRRPPSTPEHSTNAHRRVRVPSSTHHEVDPTCVHARTFDARRPATVYNVSYI